jgi:hypothetical protein
VNGPIAKRFCAYLLALCCVVDSSLAQKKLDQLLVCGESFTFGAGELPGWNGDIINAEKFQSNVVPHESGQPLDSISGLTRIRLNEKVDENTRADPEEHMVRCVAATAQSPVKMGLWDVTVHSEARASPAVAAAIKKFGLATRTPQLGFSGRLVDPPTTVRVHTCMVEDKWGQYKAQIATAPKGCVFTHPFSEDAHGMSSSVRCEATDGAMLVVIDSKLSWINREKMRMAVRLVVTFRGVAGESVGTTEVTSFFLSPDCGSVAPGASVTVK